MYRLHRNSLKAEKLPYVLGALVVGWRLRPVGPASQSHGMGRRNIYYFSLLQLPQNPHFNPEE
jgi:hypothetical protein